MAENRMRISLLSPDMLVACAAVLVGLCALGVSIYEANIFRQQQKASVWPYLELSYSNLEYFSYEIQNKGVGPAIVKWAVLKIDGKPVKNWREFCAKLPMPNGAKTSFVSSYLYKRVLSAGEKISLIAFHEPNAARHILSHADKISVEICYGSIFDEHWILKMDSSGTSNDPIEDITIDTNNLFQD